MKFLGSDPNVADEVDEAPRRSAMQHWGLTPLLQANPILKTTTHRST